MVYVWLFKESQLGSDGALLEISLTPFLSVCRFAYYLCHTAFIHELSLRMSVPSN